MKRFVEGLDRSQSSLFPDRLEDWIGDDKPVRVVDVFVDELDLVGLGFERVDDAAGVVDALGDAETVVAPHEGEGTLPGEVVMELAADALQEGDVLQSGGGDVDDAGSGALEEGVDGDGGAEDEGVDGIGLDAGALDGVGAATWQSVDGSSSGKAARSGESVFGMCAGRVVGGKGSRNTSLGPPRRARIGRRDHIRPIETQRNREAGDACPNDQRSVEP